MATTPSLRHTGSAWAPWLQATLRLGGVLRSSEQLTFRSMANSNTLRSDVANRDPPSVGELELTRPRGRVAALNRTMNDGGKRDTFAQGYPRWRTPGLGSLTGSIEPGQIRRLVASSESDFHVSKKCEKYKSQSGRCAHEQARDV